jgi:hypothetical protein
MRYLVALLIVMVPSLLIAIDYRYEQKCNKLMKSYQIDLHYDTVWIYDGERLVDSFIHTHDSTWRNGYDSILIKDNL